MIIVGILLGVIGFALVGAGALYAGLGFFLVGVGIVLGKAFHAPKGPDSWERYQPRGYETPRQEGDITISHAEVVWIVGGEQKLGQMARELRLADGVRLTTGAWLVGDDEFRVIGDHDKLVATLDKLHRGDRSLSVVELPKG